MLATFSSLEDIQASPLSERKKIYIPEALMATIPVEDNGEPSVELGEYFRQQAVAFLPTPVTPLKAKDDLYLREGVAVRLIQAAQKLKEKTESRLMLKVTDAFRPLSMQRKYFEQIRGDIAAKEGLTGQALWERVTQFIADPDLCPPHATGGAVDLTLYDTVDKQELDMGTPVDTVDDRAYTWSDDISVDAHQHRMTLLEVMESAGFVNLPTEWWHFSYGEQYWAAFHGKEKTLYRPIESV